MRFSRPRELGRFSARSCLLHRARLTCLLFTAVSFATARHVQSLRENSEEVAPVGSQGESGERQLLAVTEQS